MSPHPRFLVALLTLSAAAGGQSILEPKDRAAFDRVFDRFAGDPLHCDVKNFEPRIDFAFRFELGYFVACDIRQFDGLPGELRSFLRVRPAESAAEILLGDRFGFMGLPKEMAGANLRKVHADFQFSGVLAAGPGVYEMSLLVFDNRQRVYRHTWKAKALLRGKEGGMALSMVPNMLAPLRALPIPRVANSGAGASLTVLMNAAPLNPFSLKLRAWDRAFLLDSLSTLLRGLPHASVRVVAFNLEQQREIFRQDHFGQSDMSNLANALHDLELGTVSYEKLERKLGWAELLLSLLNGESRETTPSDAIVFLGPTTRMDAKPPRDLLAGYGEPRFPLYCVAYYPRVGRDFPDSIQHLTSALKGKVFRVHSPAELSQNLDKLKREIGTGGGATRLNRAAQ